MHKMPEDSIYHKNGEIRETRPIENGMANGVVKRYSEEGKQVQENTFINHLIKNCSPNEFVDERDGNIYKAVKIGNQIWMAENLRYKPEINADCSTPLYFDYETMAEHVYRPMPYEIDNITKIWRHHKKLGLTDNIWSKFGCLYRWTYDIQKLAPKGWRVPTNRDFL